VAKKEKKNLCVMSRKKKGPKRKKRPAIRTRRRSRGGRKERGPQGRGGGGEKESHLDLLRPRKKKKEKKERPLSFSPEERKVERKNRSFPKKGEGKRASSYPGKKGGWSENIIPIYYWEKKLLHPRGKNEARRKGKRRREQAIFTPLREGKKK